ncbi:hypothetical protein [Haloglomus salinum]|uniref:hypothetical protein n=1 Tax=Haloglomus salinum TaxID=2962673 RepID=UPI0020C97496|nr:hypothetical protein [Haloglomus salinum]
MTRKSKREIAEEVDELEETYTGEYPEVETLAGFLTPNWSAVDEERNLYENEAGEIHRIPQVFIDDLTAKED